MNAFSLALAWVKARKGNAFLHMMLLALGVATITALLLFSDYTQNRLTRDAQNIDLVVGAKGSPLQLILSSVYHMDMPTGNIKMEEAEKLRQHPLVKRTIPLALGDSYAGFRIVGTNYAYLSLYKASLKSGGYWDKTFEAVIGSHVAKEKHLKVGSTFSGAHGISGLGHDHADHPYKVTGILKPTGTVIDRLILTSVNSVIDIHAHGEEHTEEKEITALLVSVKSRAALMSLPRIINMHTSMQAANPAFETARLMSLLGIGFDVLKGVAIFLIVIAALGILIGLSSAMNERSYDLALMRALGASPLTLAGTILLESLIITVSGTLIGLVLGHGVIELAPILIPSIENTGLTGLTFILPELSIILFGIGAGVIAAFWPARRAYTVPVSKTLAKA